MGIVKLNRGIRRTQKINDKIKFGQLVLIGILFIMLSGLVCAPSPECFCNSDLAVILKPTSVSFNPANTTINQTMSVNAVVKNLNNKSANSTIEFKLNNMSIENKTISSSGFSSQTVTFNFTRTPENHTIKIIADPANEVNESNEGNNYGEIKLYNYSECGNDVCEYPENSGSCPVDCGRYYCSMVDDCVYENLENPGCSCGEYVNYRFREQGNDWGTATMISVCFIVCSPSIPACVNHECTARDYSLKINKTISEAEVKPGSKITFTLLVENMGPNKVYGVHVVDYLLQGFNYVDGSLNVYYCNETDNVTGECINYEECQHSGTVEYDCLSDDTSYFWFDAFAVGNNTLILGEFQYINGGYAYDNIENNTLLWTERYMIRFNVSVGENVTLGNYTNTANVSGYHDFERNFLIDYPDDSLEGCLTHNNYNETSGSCINSSITDDNDRTSSVIFIVLPEPEIDLMPKTLLITQNQTQNQTTANVTATINNSGNVSVNNVKIELLVDNFSIGNKTVNLSVNSETNVTFSWNATGGRHNITVKVDPDNLIVESNGYNNNLTAEIEVISCDCSSCWECEEKLNNPACLVVALTANITSHPGTCIDNPGNFSGKIFDCVGNTIGGDSSGVDYGIYLDVKSGNTIKNCGVRNFYYGIRLFSLSENSILENNNVSLNNYGILLTYFSNNNTLINNTVNSNGDAGIFLAYCSGNKIMNNMVNSNGYSGIHIEHSGGNVLERNTADNNGEHGIYLATGDSSGNLMNSNRFCNNSQKSISTHYTYYDIYNAGSNSGDGNTCDLAHSWSDVSFPLRNCTYLCTVPGKPDFAPFNLTYFPEYGNETMNVTIRAGVINLGNTSFAGEVNVSLLVDDVYGSSKILNLIGATKFYINLTYENAVKKEHNVTLFVDYGNMVDEFDENNNFLKTQVPTESPKLEVIKSVSLQDVEKGSEPLVTIIVVNPTYVPVYNLTVTDFMPPGFNYVNGTGRLNGIPIPDPYVTNSNLTLIWNLSIVSGLSELPAKTVMVLTFKSKVESAFKYNFEFINGTVNVTNLDEFPIYFNNTVNVSGAGGSGEIVRNGTQYEMRVYPSLDRAVLFKFASKSNASCYEYIEYTIVI